MMIGSTFHTYSINQSTQPVNPSTKPVEAPATTDSNHREQSTQSGSNSSSLDSLGNGNLL